jgi:predicted transglutaminase-like protease
MFDVSIFLAKTICDKLHVTSNNILFWGHVRVHIISQPENGNELSELKKLSSLSLYSFSNINGLDMPILISSDNISFCPTVEQTQVIEQK